LRRFRFPATESARHPLTLQTMGPQVMKRIVTALIVIGLVCTARVHVSRADTIAFDGSVTGPSYSVDVVGDPGVDVVFTANSQGFGGSLMDVLQGHIMSGSNDEKEVIVEFLGGATGLLAFDFGVTTPHATYPEVYVRVYDATGSKVAMMEAEGAQGHLEIPIEYGGSGFNAERACIQFCSGGGNLFWLDDFSGTFGAGPPAPVPIPHTVLLLGSGLIVLVGFRRRFRPS